MYDDIWSSLPSKHVGEELPFFIPPPPGSFEEEFKRIEIELDLLDVDVQFPTLPDSPFIAYRDTSTPSLTSSYESTESTYSTGLIEDSVGSDYSFMAHSTSNDPLPFDFAFRDLELTPESNDVDPEHNAVHPDSFMPNSFGTPQFPSALVPNVDVVRAQSEDGPYHPPVGISPHSLSPDSQNPLPAVPTDPTVGSSPATQTSTGPIRTEPICPHCGRIFDRRSNLKPHMETHNPNRKKILCPESDCLSSFTRPHDLQRHLVKKHGDLTK
ncbi:hypothetical protein EI94DRAFT_1708293 [Lactarius quietus]|nr:hypothetical protein EI94DRAFT_1708293 [Lactarius quietus]